MNKSDNKNVLIVLYDKCGDVYSSPYLFLNDATAKRWFVNLYKGGQAKAVSDNISDYEIYKIGEYSTATGIIDSYDKPLLVMKGNDILLGEKGSKDDVMEGD